MANFMKPTNRLKARYVQLIGGLVVFVFLVSLLAGKVITDSQRALQLEYDQSIAKLQITQSIEGNLTQVLFRGRGYYLFQNESDLEKIYEHLQALKLDMEELKALPLATEQRLLVEELELFHERYVTEILPESLRYVQEGDMEGIRRLSEGGVTILANRLVASMGEIQYRERVELLSITQRIFANARYLNVLISFFGLFAIVALVLLLGRILRSVIMPIEELYRGMRSIASGEEVQLEYSQREDEIGELSRAFQDMSVIIREKETAMQQQNKELLVQQEEMRTQQKKLKSYLLDIENINKALDQSAAVAITDAKGTILQVNRQFEQNTGYTAEEIIGKPARMLQSGQHGPAYYQQLWKTISSGGAWRGEFKNRRKDGTYFWENSTIVPYLNESGIPYQYIKIGIDITEMKNIQEQLAISLNETKRTTDMLENYNNFSHNLTLTFDREEFFELVFTYLKRNYEFDKGVIWNVTDQMYKSKGMSQPFVKEMIQRDHSELTHKLQEEKQFSILREALDQEAGVADEAILANDLYLAIFNTEDNIAAIVALTRIGRRFSHEEMTELNGLMRQLSIAYGRILIYQEVENERILNETIIDHVNEGIQFIAKNGVMLQYNMPLIDMMRMQEVLKEEERTMEVWLTHLLEKALEREQLEDFIRESLRSESRRGRSMRFTMENPGIKHIELYASGVYTNNEKTGTIFVYRDITREFEVDQMKSDLVNTVSHELRTPLSSVLGFTEMLLGKAVKPERQRVYLETIHKEAKRLTVLINDFLDLQRMETGNLLYEYKSLGINEVIMDTIMRFSHDAEHNLFFIDEAPRVRVRADRDRMIQVMTNLLSNSIKFSPKGGDIRIRITNEGDLVKVAVKDYGIGIPSEHMPDLFKKFKRIDNTETRKIGGTGLGLAIVKEIVEAHGGKIWAESVEGEGTEFFFTLRLEEDQKEDGKRPSLHSGPKVLLVEDDSALVLLLSEELKSQGFQVIHHGKVESAFNESQNTPLAGMVVDLKLENPGDGWELIARLRASEKTASMPIIVSTGTEPGAVPYADLGIEDYLVKPYPPSKLTETLLRVLEDREERHGVIALPDPSLEARPDAAEEEMDEAETEEAGRTSAQDHL